MNMVVFSSARQDWETPPRFFEAVNNEFGFTLDACATEENAKCIRFFSPEDDALKQEWNGVVWMNPPYGHQIGKWIEKAYIASVRGATVVALIPAKTETKWWHTWVMRSAEIRFIQGRMRFSGVNINAPFPSALVVFKRGNHSPVFSTMDRLLDQPGTDDELRAMAK